MKRAIEKDEFGGQIITDVPEIKRCPICRRTVERDEENKICRTGLVDDISSIQLISTSYVAPASLPRKHANTWTPDHLCIMRDVWKFVADLIKAKKNVLWK